MYLQGNLQVVFDVLFQMGIIDPVLEMDWADALAEMPEHVDAIDAVVSTANTFQHDSDALMQELNKFDELALGYLAMEVAREFADFHDRDSLH